MDISALLLQVKARGPGLEKATVSEESSFIIEFKDEKVSSSGKVERRTEGSVGGVDRHRSRAECGNRSTESGAQHRLQ